MVIEEGCISEYHNPFNCQYTKRTVLTEPTEEMVERAARTICDRDVDFGVKWGALDAYYNVRLVESTRNEYRHVARAALSAALFGEAP